MRPHPTHLRSLVHSALGALSLSALALCACECDEPAPPDDLIVEVGEEGPSRGIPQVPAGAGGEACVAFCERGNSCAESAGRQVPVAAQDCEASCQAGGIHAAAPALAHACAPLDCAAFASCTSEAMMNHMQRSDVPVFPMNCLGLCNRLAYCATRTGEPLEVAAADCPGACAPGGLFARRPAEAYRCANVSCGVPLLRCLDPSSAPGPDPDPTASP